MRSEIDHIDLGHITIDHINIVVGNLETMLDFYTGVLGLRVTKEVTISGAWVGRVTGIDDVVAEVVYLEPPGGGPRVELIRYRQPEAARPPGLEKANTPGLRHLAFRTSDIERAAAALRDAGVEVLSAVERVPNAQVTYAGGARKHLVYCRDPEGNLLELCSYPTRG